MHQALTNICWAVSWQFCWSTNMTVNCTSYVKSCHRALSAIILYIRFIFTYIWGARLHLIVLCMLTYMALCMTIGMLLLQWQHLFTTWQSSRSLVQRRSGLISEAKPWRYVRSPNRFAIFGPLKLIIATKTTFWSKCCWKDHANMIKWSLIVPTYRGLTIRRPGLYIYIHMFFLFRYSAFVIFVFFICMCICTVGQFEVSRRLQSVATEFIALYKAAKTAWGLLGDYFCITKKFHDLFHLAQRADEINPALTSCMQQEDLMGKIKKLMIKCVQSAKPITAVHKAITKYRLALHLEHRWTLPFESEFADK